MYRCSALKPARPGANQERRAGERQRAQRGQRDAARVHRAGVDPGHDQHARQTDDGARQLPRADALDALSRYDWPGNVRELENLVERLAILTRGATPVADLVADIKRRHPDIEVSVSAYPEKHPESPDLDADIDFSHLARSARSCREMIRRMISLVPSRIW